MTSIPANYVDSLTLRDCLALAGIFIPEGGPVAVADITRALEQLAERVAVDDTLRARAEREWLAQRFGKIFPNTED